jgi:hypothetical protein
VCVVEKIDIQQTNYLMKFEWLSLHGTAIHLQMLRNRACYTTTLLKDDEEIFPDKWNPKPTIPEDIKEWLASKSTGLYYMHDRTKKDDDLLIYFENRADLNEFTKRWHGEHIAPDS